MIQPRWTLSGHTLTHAQLLLTSTPGPFLLGLFPATLLPVCRAAQGCYDPRAGFGTWSCLNLIHLALAHWSNLSRSLCRAFLPSSRTILPPTLYYPQTHLRVHSIPSSRSSIKYWDQPQYWDLGNTTNGEPPTGYGIIHHLHWWHHSVGLLYGSAADLVSHWYSGFVIFVFLKD